MLTLYVLIRYGPTVIYNSHPNNAKAGLFWESGISPWQHEPRHHWAFYFATITPCNGDEYVIDTDPLSVRVCLPTTLRKTYVQNWWNCQDILDMIKCTIGMTVGVSRITIWIEVSFERLWTVSRFWLFHAPETRRAGCLPFRNASCHHKSTRHYSSASAVSCHSTLFIEAEWRIYAAVS